MALRFLQDTVCSCCLTNICQSYDIYCQGYHYWRLRFPVGVFLYNIVMVRTRLKFHFHEDWCEKSMVWPLLYVLQGKMRQIVWKVNNFANFFFFLIKATITYKKCLFWTLAILILKICSARLFSWFETMIDIVQISYFLKWIQNAIRYEVFGLSRTKVILDRSGDFCMLLLCWLDNLIKLVLYCLIYQTMGIKFDDRWRCNFWLTPIVKTKRKRFM